MDKYNNKLIPILDYSELPRGFSLKSCFRSPSFIALTFLLLSSNNLQQVGISMLISLVRNGDKFSLESFKISNPLSITASNLKELVSELSKVEKELSEVNILTITFTYGNNESTSMLQLVQSNQQLAKPAIEKAELPLDLSQQNDTTNKKKAKAALFKQCLMKEYQNRRKQFGSIEQSKEDKEEEDDDDEQKVIKQ